MVWNRLLIAGSLVVLAMGVVSSSHPSFCSIARHLNTNNAPTFRAAATPANAGTNPAIRLKMRLRGGASSVDLPSETEWGELGTEEGGEEVGFFPGKWDLSERLRTEPRCDFNVTDDIVRTSSKEDELAFRRQCDEELEQHRARVKRIRADDIANNRSGCRHIADNEYCVRKSDGRIWKYRYDSDLNSGCGGERGDEVCLPEPVDHVDPDYLQEIADDLDRRDRECAQNFQDLVDADDRQTALEEALSWFNGTRRKEYDAGERVWWRHITKLNASADGTQRSPQADSSEEGPEHPATAHRRAELPDDAESSSSMSEGTAQQEYRQPGELPRGEPAPDFSAYDKMPAGYCLSDTDAPRKLDEVQTRLYRQMRAEAQVINSRCGRDVISSPARSSSNSGGGGGGGGQGRVGCVEEAGMGSEKSGAFEAQNAGASEWRVADAMASDALSLFNSTAAPDHDTGTSWEANVALTAGGGVEAGKSKGYVWNELGETLRSVVWRGKASFVKELLDLGADANYRTVYCGWRPIHYAAWNDFPKVVALLVDAGADINARTDYGETPLHLCAVKASNQAIKFLLGAGADTSLRHAQGRLALESAHMRMMSCDFPLSQRIGDTVRLLANGTQDADAVRDALEDVQDHWVPPDGFCS